MSDHFDGKKFFNPEIDNNKSFFTFLKWQFTRDPKKWPEFIEDIKPVKPVISPEKTTITFVNHATVLIQTAGLNILTDPIFSERAGPTSWLGAKRVRRPGVSIEDLPSIDVVLISHNHYDHLDIDSLKKIEKKFHPLVLVPLGDKKWLEYAGLARVEEMDWEQIIKLDTVTISFEKSIHWSGRGLFDKYNSLWGSYVIRSSQKKIYFAGDTAYGGQFKKIQEKYGDFDISLLPIGAYEPRWFMKEHHMNPQEAIQAAIDLNSKFNIGIHFGTFNLTDESIDDPENNLKLNLKNKAIEFKVPKNGESFLFDELTSKI